MAMLCYLYCTLTRYLKYKSAQMFAAITAVVKVKQPSVKKSAVAAETCGLSDILWTIIVFFHK